jgi:hypothetical protein
VFLHGVSESVRLDGAEPNIPAIGLLADDKTVPLKLKLTGVICGAMRTNAGSGDIGRFVGRFFGGEELKIILRPAVADDGAEFVEQIDEGGRAERWTGAAAEKQADDLRERHTRGGKTGARIDRLICDHMDHLSQCRAGPKLGFYAEPGWAVCLRVSARRTLRVLAFGGIGKSDEKRGASAGFSFGPNPTTLALDHAADVREADTAACELRV